jgi:serine/threonine protein kinase
MADLLNTHLGQYRLTEVIRRGGMATVYKAYQESLDRYVAVKVLFHSQDPQFAMRFKREARAIAHLQHPNSCRFSTTASRMACSIWCCNISKGG